MSKMVQMNFLQFIILTVAASVLFFRFILAYEERTFELRRLNDIKQNRSKNYGLKFKEISKQLTELS